MFGMVFAMLHNTIKNVGSKSLIPKSIYISLKSNLDRLAPAVEEIRRLNIKLNCPEEEIKRSIEDMKKVEELICEFKTQRWNYLFQPTQARKLAKFSEAIMKFFQVHMPAQVRWDTLPILEELKSLEEKLPVKKSGESYMVERPPDFTVGLDLPLKKLKKQLLNEKEQHVLLTAPGGCGKTTLAKMLCQDKEIKGHFKDNIIFVHVSKTPNLMVIVRRLLHHMCDHVPEVQSDEDAINQMRKLLEQIGSNPILLILDDVWSGSELLEMFHMRNIYILVTSRTKFPKFNSICELQPLNDEDAMTLFRHSASLQDGSSHIQVEDIKKIVRGCGGFPLALVVIGRSLKGNSVEAWGNIAPKWSDSHFIFKSSSNLLDCLRTSLKFSDREVIFKWCFMDLGSFPEGQRISVGALIDMWVELYKLDGDGNSAIAILLELSNRNLANLVNTRKEGSEVAQYYSEDFVTQLDLLRELAMYESSQGPIGQRQKLFMDISENTLPSWCTDQDRQLTKARLLSISTDETFLSSWCSIQAPKVEVLVLNFRTKNYSLPEFVKNMNKLKALIITNYGFFPAELRNFELLKSLSKLRRIRLEKISIPSLCKAPILLRSLKKISLFMCKIDQAFGNCSIQVSDALPNLMEINIDYCQELVELPAVLCDFFSLKKLSITNCHRLSTLPNGIEKLLSLQVLMLRACTDLSELPESIKCLRNLSILDISDCVSIRQLPKHIGELCSLKELRMAGCLRLREIPPSAMDFEQLKLVICDEKIVMLWEPIKEFLTNLEVKVAKKDFNLYWLKA